MFGGSDRNRMTWVWHVTRTGWICVCEIHIKFWLGSLKGRDHLEAILLRWEDNIKVGRTEVVYKRVNKLIWASTNRDSWLLVMWESNLELAQSAKDFSE